MNLSTAETVRPRTLILTHLRKSEAHNLDRCTRLWKLSDPVFKDGKPFEHRLSLVEEGGCLPDGPYGSGIQRIFSWSGAIDDDSSPPGYAHLMYEFTPASAYGFAGSGFNQIFLGGGNLDFCLLRTFESLVRQKVRQGENFQAIIPLALVYCSEKVDNPFDYIVNPNHYSRSLEKSYQNKTIGGYSIVVDGNPLLERPGSSPNVELHWFTVLKKMFASPFFPEINNESILQRVFGNFIIHAT